MTTHDDDIRAAMAALRADYLTELPSQLAALRTAIDDARRGGWTKEGVRKAVKQAHMIHGTAGSYRFTEISEAAGRLEDALTGIDAGWLPPEDAWPEMQRALDDMTKALHDADAQP
jgi:HPt (histidine-containing phosphotransfer) domain-containing protein